MCVCVWHSKIRAVCCALGSSLMVAPKLWRAVATVRCEGSAELLAPDALHALAPYRSRWAEFRGLAESGLEEGIVQQSARSRRRRAGPVPRRGPRGPAEVACVAPAHGDAAASRAAPPHPGLHVAAGIRSRGPEALDPTVAQELPNRRAD